MFLNYQVEQCGCGFVQRVQPGELIPDGWHRHFDGSLMCPRCWNPKNDRSRERALGEGT